MSAEFYLSLALPRIIPRQRVGTKLRSIAKGIKSYADRERGGGHIKGPSAITDRPEIGTERFPFRLPLSLTITYLPHVASYRVAVRRATRTIHTCVYMYIRKARECSSENNRDTHGFLLGVIAPSPPPSHATSYSIHPPPPLPPSRSSSSRVRRRRLVSHGPALFRTL